jgi:uncharacterized protein with von Willebrand factor type A (vWA) domain
VGGAQELDLISDERMAVAVVCAQVTAEHNHSVKPDRVQTIEVSKGGEDLADQQTSMLKKGQEPAQAVLILMDDAQKHCRRARHSFTPKKIRRLRRTRRPLRHDERRTKPTQGATSFACVNSRGWQQAHAPISIAYMSQILWG